MEQNEALAANELGDHVGDVEGKQIETTASFNSKHESDAGIS